MRWQEFVLGAVLGLAALGFPFLLVWFISRDNRSSRREDDARRILSAIDNGCQWGYELYRYTRMRPYRVYTALATLENRGLIDSDWDDSCPPRRVYFRANQSAAGSSGDTH